MSYDANNLYEDAYNINFNWQKWLSPIVYKYHELVWKEFNSPVELQMGVLLPFVAACCGPRTSGLWSTEPGTLNLFWLNVAASGVGKSRARKKLISEPLEYMCQNIQDVEFPDFEVSRFTRPGMYSITYFTCFINFYIIPLIGAICEVKLCYRY